MTEMMPADHPDFTAVFQICAERQPELLTETTLELRKVFNILSHAGAEDAAHIVAAGFLSDMITEYGAVRADDLSEDTIDMIEDFQSCDEDGAFADAPRAIQLFSLAGAIGYGESLVGRSPSSAAVTDFMQTARPTLAMLDQRDDEDDAGDAMPELRHLRDRLKSVAATLSVPLH